MAAQSQSAARQQYSPEVQKLRVAIENIDCLSQGGFSVISSIAKLALNRLETPDAYQHLDDIANALRAISVKADDIENCIGTEAEGIGCSYVNQSQRRRWAAHSAYLNSLKG